MFKGEETLPTLHLHRQSAYLMGRDRKVMRLRNRNWKNPNSLNSFKWLSYPMFRCVTSQLITRAPANSMPSSSTGCFYFLKPCLLCFLSHFLPCRLVGKKKEDGSEMNKWLSSILHHHQHWEIAFFLLSLLIISFTMYPGFCRMSLILDRPTEPIWTTQGFLWDLSCY